MGMAGDSSPLGFSHDLISSVPLHLLQAELRRRQEEEIPQAPQVPQKPACGSTANLGSYNVAIHVFALVLILVVSTLACSFPIIARRFPDLPIPHRVLFLSRHFGTGVLLATAFIHLLPTAFISMTDPCLPRFWNEIYPPMPGLIAMLSVFAVVVIEMFFAMKGAGHSHGGDWHTLPDEGLRRTSLIGRQESTSGRIPLHTIVSPAVTQDDLENGHAKERSPRPSHDSDSDLDDLEALDPMPDESVYLSQAGAHKHHPDGSAPLASNNDVVMTENPQKQLVQCLLLEAGILFHSVFIGMAVSVASGTSFVVLLIAISFHQTFEGFALGSRIAALIPDLFEPTSPKPWLMALAYGTTTPIGQALGLLLHRMYDPQSEAGLLVVGVTNAISSGLLLFAGLVQLMAEDFLSDRSYEILRGRRRIEACLAVAAGGMLMAIVGAFA